MGTADLFRVLAQAALFRGLPDPELKTILEAAGRRRVEAGAFFFHQDDPAHALYVLTEGRVRLSQVTPDGQQVILRFINPGGLFGGIAALGETVYPAAAQAVDDSLALAWESQTITRLMERHPRLTYNALQLLGARVQELQDRLRELATERVERRLARTILRLVRQAGRKTADGILIDLPLSRQNLAEMSGTTLYTASRILSQWEKRGLVDTGRERVLLRFPHGLVAIAEDLARPPSSQDP